MTLPDTLSEEEAIQYLKDNARKEHCSETISDELNSLSDEFIYDAEQDLDPSDNDNQNTIELYNDEHNMIWDNVTGKENH